MKAGIKLEEKLYQYRKKNKLSQEELAGRLSVTRQAVSRWERGESAPPVDVLKKMAEIYGTSLDELVNENEIKKEKGQQQEGKAIRKLFENNDLVLAVLVTILCCVACGIPIVGIAVQILVLWKYKSGEKKYTLLVKAVAFICLAVALYSLYLYISFRFIDNGYSEIEKISQIKSNIA